ncbi:protein-tyrosine kinase [Alistipes communis]|uniref:protein-tyrosine kinase n=1 Tax=Alistipes communis TaxID=2585118 RepID=UPI003AEFEFE1
MYMTTSPITIKHGLVTIRPTANGVWLTQSQIADLFGVFSAAVSTNIRVILKSGVLYEDRVVRRTRGRNGNIVERFSFEMITALAFRLKSENAEVFRRWIIERATTLAIVWKVPTSKDRMLN